ncbi:MAG: tetratricopeptide repeat protein [Acidobacteria bacterium]|nr:MAG: tetratricopeptide repeat protein [Acidobacteriota bacterium]
MPPEGDRLCPRCGQLIPAGQAGCPVCTRPQGFLWSLERETLVLLSMVLLAIFFGVTGFTVKRYHASQQALGGRWYLKGEAALQANRPEEAVDDFHTALVYARDNTLYQKRLAEALVKANNLVEAKAYLQTLWVRQPGDGAVNLELARLSGDAHNIPEAIRYYQNAVFGVWEFNPEGNRRDVRLELSKFLLAEGERNAAESELIALQADLPPDASLHTQVGLMFVQVEDYRRALNEFQQALKLDPKLEGAWAGAGEASYQLADFTQARRYFRRAIELNPRNQEAAMKFEMSRLIIDLDPFQRRLTQKERGRRTIENFQRALSHLKQCAQSRGVNLQIQQSTGPFASVYSSVKRMQPKVSRKILRANPDLIPNVMDLVMQMEETAQQACGVPPPPDQALLMISHTRGATER